jgi:hypothetical protein
MKGCWIGILGTSALVISAFGQNGVGPQALATNSRLGVVSPDKRLLLPSTGRKMADDQTQTETEQVSEVQVSGETLVVLPPDASHNVPTAIVEYLDLTPLQIAAIQSQIAVQRGQVQSMMKQLIDNRRELIATTLKGRFDIHQVRKLAAQQTRILEPLIIANAHLQTEIYKLLTVEQQRKLDGMRKETAGFTNPYFTEW